MDLALPCRCVFPERGEEEGLFSPGILFKSESKDVLASAALTPESRYDNSKSFWKKLGLASDRVQFERTRFDVVLAVAGSPVWVLQGRAKNWDATTTNEVVTAAGAPAGSVEVRRPRFKMFTDKVRATFRDARDAEVGYYEQRLTLVSGAFRFVDAVRNWEYTIEYDGQSGRWGFIRSEQTDVIDTRLLLAWCYYVKFHNEPD